MSNQCQNMSYQLTPLLEIFFKAFLKKYLKTRYAITQEIITYLELDEKFQRAVRKIRQEYKIPKLSPRADLVEIPFVTPEKSINITDSSWLHGQPQSIQNGLDTRIKVLIRKHKLPEGFYDWLEAYILYGKKQAFKGIYYADLLNQVLKSSAEFHRTPLTTGEKQIAKFLFAQHLGIRRRPSKRASKDYKLFNEVLSTNKNKLRPFRSYHSALKTLTVGKEIKIESVNSKTGEVSKAYERFTYDKLVARLHKSETGNRDITHSRRYRKQKQRLLERMEKLTGKKFKK